MFAVILGIGQVIVLIAVVTLGAELVERWVNSTPVRKYKRQHARLAEEFGTWRKADQVQLMEGKPRPPTEQVRVRNGGNGGCLAALGGLWPFGGVVVLVPGALWLYETLEMRLIRSEQTLNLEDGLLGIVIFIGAVIYLAVFLLIQVAMRHRYWQTWAQTPGVIRERGVRKGKRAEKDTHARTHTRDSLLVRYSYLVDGIVYESDRIAAYERPPGIVLPKDAEESAWWQGLPEGRFVQVTYRRDAPDQAFLEGGGRFNIVLPAVLLVLVLTVGAMLALLLLV